MEYEVIVKTETTVYVEADSEEEAERLACVEALSICPDDTQCWVTPVE